MNPIPLALLGQVVKFKWLRLISEFVRSRIELLLTSFDLVAPLTLRPGIHYPRDKFTGLAESCQSHTNYTLAFKYTYQNQSNIFIEILKVKSNKIKV